MATGSTHNSSNVVAMPLPTQPTTERKLFGTDGVRGVANQHPMTCEVALMLGCVSRE